MNLAGLQKKHADQNQRANNAEKKAAELRAQLARTKIEIEEAATGGTIESYKALKAQAQDLENEAYFYETQARSLSRVIDKAEALEVWEEYASKHEKGMKKELAEYEKDLKALAVKYEKLIAAQNDALHTREDLAALCGADKDYFKVYFLPDKRMPNDRRLTHAEAVLFVGAGIWTQAKETDYFYPSESTLQKVLVMHEAVKDLSF